MEDPVADRYRRFAREARGRSARYAEWAEGVATDAGACAILERIPPGHRQAPLVFAVTRMLGAPDAGYGPWREWLEAHADDVVREASGRSVQTNEPLRCAALLPALSLVEGPVALLEVGASAGLCVYPDRYSYAYERPDGDVVRLGAPDAPLLRSSLRGPGAPPLRIPQVVWRAGIDLHPLDASDPVDRDWLVGLVWPGEAGRAERISAALDVVAAERPRIVAGDAAQLLPSLAAQAPADATLVITTPGVLPHVPAAGRRLIADGARALGRWITLDPPGLGTVAVPADFPGDGFALALDGEVLAAADPLGGWLEWLPQDPPARA